MPTSIRDVKSSSPDRQWIENIYSEYLDDLSGQNTGLFPMIGEHGARGEELFAHWFANDKAHPLVIVQGKETVGFALVSRPTMHGKARAPADYRMSEFFVRRNQRRKGIGSDAATLIFNRFAGEWEIVEYLRNSGAVAFWRRVLNGYCPGQFTERTQNGEVHQSFKTRRGQRR
jgi:predicted acetyltransferase